MKELVQAIQNRDGQVLSRISSPKKPKPNACEAQAAQVFNEVFRQLQVIFPAAVANLKGQSDLNEFRRQWLLAFVENGITTIAQVGAGMTLARQRETPWIPSPGQFVAWCREGSLRLAGLPSDDELVEIVRHYCRERGFLAAPEAYSWKHPAHYWMVTALYGDMRANNWTEKELLEGARRELTVMAERIRNGESIPEPVLVLEEKQRPPMTSEDALQRIAETRKRLGLPRRVK